MVLLRNCQRREIKRPGFPRGNSIIEEGLIVVAELKKKYGIICHEKRKCKSVISELSFIYVLLLVQSHVTANTLLK